jgi:hypothetical protein
MADHTGPSIANTCLTGAEIPVNNSSGLHVKYIYTCFSIDCKENSPRLRNVNRYLDKNFEETPSSNSQDRANAYFGPHVKCPISWQRNLQHVYIMCIAFQVLEKIPLIEAEI